MSIRRSEDGKGWDVIDRQGQVRVVFTDEELDELTDLLTYKIDNP